MKDAPALRRLLSRLLAMRKPSRVVLEEAAAALDPVADRELLGRLFVVLSRLA